MDGSILKHVEKSEGSVEFGSYLPNASVSTGQAPPGPKLAQDAARGQDRRYASGFGMARNVAYQPSGSGANQRPRRPARGEDRRQIEQPGHDHDVASGIDLTSNARSDVLDESLEFRPVPAAIPREATLSKLESIFVTSDKDTDKVPLVELVETVLPITSDTTQPNQFDPYILPIAELLSLHLSKTTKSLPPTAIQRSITAIILWCYTRILTLNGDLARTLKGKSKDDGSLAEMEVHLSRVLIRLGVDGEQRGKGGMLTRFRKCLSGVKDYTIGIPVVAAWVVLRQDSGEDGLMKEGSKFIWPSSRSVLEYLDEVFKDMALDRTSLRYADSALYLMAVKSLPDLPPSLDALRSRLTTIVQHGTEEQAITLYKVYRAYLNTPDPHFRQPPGILDPDVRNDVLSRFLYAFTSTRFGNDAPIQPLRLEMMCQEVLRELDKPWGLEVWHSLVAHRARAVEGSPVFEDGREVISMLEYEERLAAQAEMKRSREEGSTAPGSRVRQTGNKEHLDETKREAALERLMGTWGMMKEERVQKDLKVYMLMIEGLGRLGDVEGLQGIWNELVNNEDLARRQRAEAEAAKAPLPLTKALNHMISACLLIPRSGPPIALQLFEQATAPKSSIPCDLITINVVLRHYARQADIPQMKQLFLLASKLNLKPDAITFATLIQGLLRAGADEQAKLALDSMYSAGIEMTERMCSMLIADLSKEGHKTGLAHAEEILNEMKKRGFAITVVTWTTLISGYFKGGWESNAWLAVRRMEGSQVYLNRIAYNVILREAGRAKGGDGVLMRIFRRMLGEGVEPNGDTYYIVLGPLVRGKRWEEAEEVVREMNRYGFRPEKGNLKKVLWQLEVKR